MSARIVGWRFPAVAVVILPMLAAAPAWARADFSGLPMKPGDVMYVTEATGVEISGLLTSISSSSLTLDGYRFEPTNVVKIERRGDALWNGTLIGLAAGAGLTGMIAGLGDCVAVECQKGPSLLGAVAAYRAIGAFIDWRHRGRTIVFEVPAATKPTVRLVPAIAPGCKTIGLVVSF